MNKEFKHKIESSPCDCEDDTKTKCVDYPVSFCPGCRTLYFKSKDGYYEEIIVLPEVIHN